MPNLGRVKIQSNHLLTIIKHMNSNAENNTKKLKTFYIKRLKLRDE